MTGIFVFSYASVAILDTSPRSENFNFIAKTAKKDLYQSRNTSPPCTCQSAPPCAPNRPTQSSFLARTKDSRSTLKISLNKSIAWNSSATMSEYLKDLELYQEQKNPPAVPQPPAKKFQPKPDPILLKLHPDPHPLSAEEQVFFVKLTEGAFGFNEHVRNETLQTLARDFHVKFLAPYLSQFINDAICVNIAFPDLSLLIYSVRVVKSLMANPHVNIKEHLHLLLPAVISCVVSRKISKYSYDNHWTLRDFSAQVVATICCTHSNSINQMKTRVIKVYLRAVQDPRKPLTTVYGGLKGLSCFGEETVRTCLVPLIPVLSRRVCMVLEKTVYLGDPSHETKQIKRITDLVLAVVGPVLLQCKNVNDGGVSYVKEFGYLGYTLYNHVKHLEKIEAERKNHFNVYLLCR